MIQPYPFHVNLVIGPPLAGKTTYVQRHMTPGDLVIDLDVIAAALSLSSIHEDNPKNLKFSWKITDAALTQLALGSTEPNHRAWVIGCFRLARRDNIIRLLRPDRTIVIATPAETCLSRLRLEVSSRPKQILSGTIRTWWKEWDGMKAEMIEAQ